MELEDEDRSSESDDRLDELLESAMYLAPIPADIMSSRDMVVRCFASSWGLQEVLARYARTESSSRGRGQSTRVRDLLVSPSLVTNVSKDRTPHRVSSVPELAGVRAATRWI